MRAILILSFAVTTAIVSTSAFAAGEGTTKPAQNLIRILPAPKPVVSAPVVQIKQGLPVTRQIVPEAAGPDPVPQAPAPIPAVKAAAPAVPELTGTLRPEVPTAAAAAPPADQPVEPKIAEKPADAPQLVEGDAAPAPQAEEQAAPQPAPVAPILTVKPRKKFVRYYKPRVRYYQPRVRYSSSYGYGGCE